MKIKKMLPVLCMALGLTLAVPLTSAATGGTGSTVTTESSGWHTDKATGRFYYVNSSGKRVTGFQKISFNISGSTKTFLYYFDSDGLIPNLGTGKVKIGNKYYYSYGPGSNFALATNTWITSQGKKLYLAGSDGELKTKTVVKVGSRLYGFGSTGKIWGKGRHRLNGSVYYATSDGYLRTKYWQKIGSRYYYFGADGRMTGQAKRTIGGKTYYYQVDTSKSSLPVYKNGWHTDSSGNRYYADSRGRLATGIKTIDGKRYYFKKNGVLAKSVWAKVNGKYYRTDSNGIIQTGWFKVGSKRYYGGTDGARRYSLQTIDGKLYYFSRSGVNQTGWQTVKGNRYYFDPNLSGTNKGAARTGWFKVSKKTYYAQSNGVLVTGWVVYNNARYYLDPNDGGAAVMNRTVTIGGTKYTFDSQGRQEGWEPTGPLSIKVDRQRNMVVVYKGVYPIKVMLCSTGLNNATPTGTFRILDKLRTHELNGPTWGHYCSHITSDILFHSLPESSIGVFPAHKYNLLGQQASQGCIRLRMGDAYWIYNNCPVGTPVTVGDYIIPDSIPKPVYKTVPESLTVDPTDPNNTVNSSWA